MGNTNRKQRKFKTIDVNSQESMAMRKKAASESLTAIVRREQKKETQRSCPCPGTVVEPCPPEHQRQHQHLDQINQQHQHLDQINQQQLTQIHLQQQINLQQQQQQNQTLMM
jgi:hypothetical protein